MDTFFLCALPRNIHTHTHTHTHTMIPAPQHTHLLPHTSLLTPSPTLPLPSRLRLGRVCPFRFAGSGYHMCVMCVSLVTFPRYQVCVYSFLCNATPPTHWYFGVFGCGVWGCGVWGSMVCGAL